MPRKKIVLFFHVTNSYGPSLFGQDGWILALTKIKLAVIKDYESAFDAVTLIQIPEMISLSDFQPRSIAEIDIFHQQAWFYRKIFQCVHVTLTEEVPVQTTMYVA